MGKKGGAATAWSTPVGAKSQKKQQQERKQKQQKKAEKAQATRNPPGAVGTLCHPALADLFGGVFSYLNAASQGALRSTCYEMFLRFNTAVYYEHHLGIVASRSGLLQKALEQRDSVWFPVSVQQLSEQARWVRPNGVLIPASMQDIPFFAEAYDKFTKEELTSSVPLPSYPYRYLPAIIVDLEMLPWVFDVSTTGSTTTRYADPAASTTTTTTGGGGSGGGATTTKVQKKAVSLFDHLQGVLHIMFRSSGYWHPHRSIDARYTSEVGRDVIGEQQQNQQQRLAGPWDTHLGPRWSQQEAADSRRKQFLLSATLSAAVGEEDGPQYEREEMDFISDFQTQVLPRNFCCECPHLKEVVFGEGCDSFLDIGDNFLAKCWKLEDVDFRGLNQVIRIKKNFLSASLMKKINFDGIGSNLAAVGDGWLEECSLLEEVQWGVKSLAMIAVVAAPTTAKKNKKGGPSKSSASSKPKEALSQNKQEQGEAALDNTNPSSSTSTSILGKQEGMMKHLVSVGNGWLSGSGVNKLNFGATGSFPQLKVVGSSFLSHCPALQSLSFLGLNALEEIGSYSLCCCHALQYLTLDGLTKVKKIGDKFAAQGFSGTYGRAPKPDCHLEVVDITGLGVSLKQQQEGPPEAITSSTSHEENSGGKVNNDGSSSLSTTSAARTLAPPQVLSCLESLGSGAFEFNPVLKRILIRTHQFDEKGSVYKELARSAKNSHCVMKLPGGRAEVVERITTCRKELPPPPIPPPRTLPKASKYGSEADGEDWDWGGAKWAGSRTGVGTGGQKRKGQ